MEVKQEVEKMTQVEEMVRKRRAGVWDEAEEEIGTFQNYFTVLVRVDIQLIMKQPRNILRNSVTLRAFSLRHSLEGN